MGKKRERELREEVEQLRASHARRSEVAADARRKTVEGLSAALESMRAEPFLIVTKSGHVVKGRASTTNVHQPVARIAFVGDSSMTAVPSGPREYSASITIEPITNSEV